MDPMALLPLQPGAWLRQWVGGGGLPKNPSREIVVFLLFLMRFAYYYTKAA